MKAEQDNTEPTMQEVTEYQSMLTDQIAVLTHVYETIDSEILQAKIRSKIGELIDLM